MGMMKFEFTLKDGTVGTIDAHDWFGVISNIISLTDVSMADVAALKMVFNADVESDNSESFVDDRGDILDA